jgi:hypothetical protein
VSKPNLFKIHGCWVWMCTHPGPASEGETGDPVVHSGRFTADAWRDPWTACHASALEHHAVHHGAVNAEEV